MGMGVAAIVVVWLVFSVLKKVIGLIVLGAVVIGAYMLWKDPALLNTVVKTVERFVGLRV